MSARLFCTAFMTAATVLTGITACSPGMDDAGTQPTQKENHMSKPKSCTGLGSYALSLSVNGSNPLLPDSIQGRDYTPLVRLGGTHEDQDPATVFLSLFAGLPEPATTQDFKGLKLGEEITFRGYTLKITSICDGNAGFDLVSQTE